jgi:hypothetical protein
MDKTNRRRILLFALLALTAPKARPSASEGSPPRVLAEFSIEPGADLILLPVHVGGTTREFLLDTGSTVSVFDRSLSSGAPIGQVAVSPPSGPSVEKRLYAAPEASVGGLDMRSAGPVLYNDFAPMRAVSDRGVWGLIGMQFLKNYIVQVDFDSQRVRFLDPRTTPRPDWGSAVPMRIGGAGIPEVVGRIEGQEPEIFQIDTGDNEGGNLAHSLFERLFPEQRGATAKNLMFTGMRSSPSGRLPRLSVGELSYRGVVFETARISSLGMTIVRRSVVTFDFPRGTLYLRPGRQFTVEEPADMSGLHLLRLEGRIVTLAIDPGSPAAQAGMQSGDVILGAAGRPETQRDIVALRQLLRSGSGQMVTLDVLRGDRKIAVELQLRKLL